jgi:hypothetical protein
MTRLGVRAVRGFDAGAKRPPPWPRQPHADERKHSRVIPRRALR